MKVLSRGEWYLRLLCIFLILASGCANNVKPIPKPESVNSLKQHLYDLPKNVAQDSKDTFLKTDNIVALALAGGASIAMNQGADNDIAGKFEGHHIFHNFTDRGLKSLGNPGFHAAGAGFWYLMSAENDDDFNKERAWTMIRALTLTDLATASLKAIRDNDTPVGDRWAWPSGHTSSSFAVASVLDEFYGPQVGIPAYAAASLVGLRMIDQGDHWTSDVIFGAVLGWVVGHTVAGKHMDMEVAGFKIQPFTGVVHDQQAMGVSLLKRF